MDKRFENKLLVNMEELCEMLSCGKRRAERIGKLAHAEVIIGNMRRWNVDKIREFLYNEAL